MPLVLPTLLLFLSLPPSVSFLLARDGSRRREEKPYREEKLLDLFRGRRDSIDTKISDNRVHAHHRVSPHVAMAMRLREKNKRPKKDKETRVENKGRKKERKKRTDDVRRTTLLDWHPDAKKEGWRRSSKESRGLRDIHGTIESIGAS